MVLVLLLATVMRAQDDSVTALQMFRASLEQTSLIEFNFTQEFEYLLNPTTGAAFADHLFQDAMNDMYGPSQGNSFVWQWSQSGWRLLMKRNDNVIAASGFDGANYWHSNNATHEISRDIKRFYDSITTPGEVLMSIEGIPVLQALGQVSPLLKTDAHLGRVLEISISQTDSPLVVHLTCYERDGYLPRSVEILRGIRRLVCLSVEEFRSASGVRFPSRFRREWYYQREEASDLAVISHINVTGTRFKAPLAKAELFPVAEDGWIETDRPSATQMTIGPAQVAYDRILREAIAIQSGPPIEIVESVSPESTPSAREPLLGPCGIISTYFAARFNGVNITLSGLEADAGDVAGLMTFQQLEDLLGRIGVHAESYANATANDLHRLRWCILPLRPSAGQPHHFLFVLGGKQLIGVDPPNASAIDDSKLSLQWRGEVLTDKGALEVTSRAPWSMISSIATCVTALGAYLFHRLRHRRSL